MAAWVLTELAEQPFQPVTGERVGRNVRNKIFQKLQTREDRFLKQVLKAANISNDEAIQEYKTRGGLVSDASRNTDDASCSVWIGPLQIDGDDVEYLLEVWRNRCAITGARLGTVLELVRWDEGRPSTCDNLILVSQHAKQAWDQTISKDSDESSSPRRGGRHGLDPVVRQTIEARLATCRVDSRA